MLKSAQQALGLYRTPNQLGVAQDGAYVRLDECVIRSKDVVEPRLGHSLLANYINSNRNDVRRFNALFQSSVGYLGQYGSGTTSGVMCLDELTGTAILSDVDPPSVWSRTKFADCQKRCYLTTDMGMKRIDSSLVGAAAGGLRPITGGAELAYAIYSASGYLPVNSAVMYRAALVSFAPDGSEIVGPPSGRAILRTPPVLTANAGNVVRNTNVITVTTTASHGFKVGQLIEATFNVADRDVNEFTNGQKAVASVVSATSFTIAETAANYTSTQAATFTIGPALGRVTVEFPTGVDTTTAVRLYRSEVSTGYTSTPSDDVYQVFDAYLTAANVSAGYITIDDNTPEVLLGDPAYWSPSVEGELAVNDPPPLARDVCSVGDVLVLADLTYPHILEFRLLATGTPNLAAGDTLTFTRGSSSFTMTASATNTGSGLFLLYSGDTVARDIEKTAQSLVDGINATAGNTWLRAEYISSASDAPGMMRVVALDFVSTVTTLISSESASWAPNLPVAGTTVFSKQELDPAGIAWSKPGQPDAFPPANRQRAGASSERALRVLSVRENAIVLKEESAWLLSGGGPFRVDLLDDTCGFPLPDTAAVLDNQVFCLSTIGVVAVSEAGVAKYGSPIEGDTRNVSEQAGRLRSLIAAGYTPHCLASWGASDETEHRYLLALPSSVVAPAIPATHEHLTDIVWCFNAGSKVWSGPFRGNWRHAHRWVSASSSSRLAFARHDLPAITKEQGLDAPEAFRHADYIGRTLYVSAKSTNTLTLLGAVGGAATSAGLAVGDSLFVSATGFGAIVTALGAEGSVTVDDASGIDVAATVLVLKAFEVVAEWVPLHGGAFPADKQLSGVVVTLSEERFRESLVKVSSEVSGVEVDAKTLSRRGFGSDMARQSDGSVDDEGFGAEPFGHLSPLRRERCQVPRDVQSGGFHSVVFRVKEAGAFFRLHGLSLDFESTGIKGVR